jgi:hypothetical protein
MSDEINEEQINSVLDKISKQIRQQTDVEIKISEEENHSENQNSEPSPLTYMKDENDIQWTESIEIEVKKFAEICRTESENTKWKAKKHYYTGRFIQIFLIILGSLSVYSSASSLNVDTKNSINIFTGFSTTVLSSIYTIFGFTKKATLEFEASLSLDNISKMLSYEILKPPHQRKSPFDIIYFSNMSRDKIVKKLGM